MKKILLIAILAVVASTSFTSKAHANLINVDFQSTIFNDNNIWFYGMANSFNIQTSLFQFDTNTGIGTFNAQGTVAGQAWTMNQIYSGVSFINPAGGYNPAGNKDLYFDYLRYAQPGVPGGYMGATAIVFDHLEVALTADNGSDQRHFTDSGPEMGMYAAYIHYKFFGSQPGPDFTLSYWYDVDANQDGNPDHIVPHGYGDHYWMGNTTGGSNAVPEPATMTLLGMGLAGLGMRKKAKK